MELLLANVERAGDHAAALGVLAVVAVVGGLIWGVAHLVSKSRAGRRNPEA
jgi:hypothetical protein